MLLDNKIDSIEDLEKIITAPVLGDIPKSKSNQVNIDLKKDKSSVAEAFRLLRTNINFMLSGDRSEAKCIFVTSSIGGEGKTFTCINLALSMAATNKKVLLIGADLRKPKIKKYLELDSEIGLTNYLVDRSLNISNIVLHTKTLRNRCDSQEPEQYHKRLPVKRRSGSTRH